MLTDAERQALIEAATAARNLAYAPYSHFAVGAALLAADGRIFTGCNVENASFSLTCCAERNAVFHAVAQGARKLSAIAVVTGNGVTPCGPCRQVLAEFNSQMEVVVAEESGRFRTYTLSELLPEAFLPDQLPSVG